ncbi:MAG: murein biosynthesis integral membrane protein MurJ [Gemmatimonadaceae bacterium]
MSEHTGKSSVLVAAGIFLSRVTGLVRESIFAHFFGTSISGDAFNAAFRIPNLLQNLFGEGVLSASFIPEYAGLRAREQHAEATRLAGAVLALLATVAAVFVLVGILLAPVLVAVIAPGFVGEKRELTVQLTRILFPGAALLVLSAWCLGILNSHRRFFLPYVAPVIWNASLIATLLFFGADSSQPQLAVYLAWGSVVGSALQFAVQLPVVIPLIKGARITYARASESVQRVVRNFVPVFFGRGVVQVSAYFDTLIASLVVSGALAAVVYAQILYLLPISLFAMSVSAAELPAMSSLAGDLGETGAHLRTRLRTGLRRIAFFVVPSAAAFLFLGDIIVGAIYERGEFSRADTIWVWQILIGSSIGLLAFTLSRLYASTFYATRDTRTPVRYAIIRIAISVGLGLILAVWLPRALDIDRRLGAVGLTLAGGIAGWVEYALLRHGLAKRIGHVPVEMNHLMKLIALAAVAAAVSGWMRTLFIGDPEPLVLALAILPVYGAIYLSLAWLLGVSELTGLLKRGAR